MHGSAVLEGALRQDTYLALKRMERGKVIEEEQLFERKIEGREGRRMT